MWALGCDDWRQTWTKATGERLRFHYVHSWVKFHRPRVFLVWLNSLSWAAETHHLTHHAKGRSPSLTLALCRQSERRPWSRLFLPSYRPFLPLLLLPLTLWDSATPSCFCGSFIYRVVLEWDHVLFIPGWYDRRSFPRPSFIEIKLTWNIIFLLRAWHDDLIYVYIAKWSPQ